MTLMGTLLIPAVGMIIIPIILHIRSQHRADIRYNLSSPIQVPQPRESVRTGSRYGSETMERWKQTDYNLSFSSSVVHHDLKMNSQGDKPEVFSDREGIEVVYPILPPGGEFVLTLATVGKTIDAENVTILHSKGSATDAFSGKREWGTMLSSAVLLLMTVLFGGGVIRSTLLSSVQSASYYDKPSDFLAQEKPFYLSSREWRKCRDEVIDRMLRRFYQDISESTTYTLLCGTQPEFLSSSEWDGLRKTAISVFEDDFNREVNAAVNSSDALLLLELRQPVNWLLKHGHV